MILYYCALNIPEKIDQFLDDGRIGFASNSLSLLLDGQAITAQGRVEFAPLPVSPFPVLIPSLYRSA